jgi:hypothetical protein
MELGNGTAAYRRAYNVAPGTKPESIRVNATRLLKHPSVAPMVESIREKSTERAQLSREWVMERLKNNAEDARVAEDYAASNKALELLGKTKELGGMWIERTEANVISDNRHHHSAEPVSPFAEHLAEVIGDGTEDEAPRALPN